MKISESSARIANLMTRATAKGNDPMVVVERQMEYMGSEDELACCVGLGAGAAGSKLKELGYVAQDELTKDYESGKVMVYSAPNPENPGEMSRIFVVTKGDTVALVQQDATPNRDPEAMDTYMHNMASQVGITRPADSEAQPATGGVGTVQGMA
jgi:hypothetical protein